MPAGDKGLVESFNHAPLPEGTIVPADGYYWYPLSPYFWGPDVFYSVLNETQS